MSDKKTPTPRPREIANDGFNRGGGARTGSNQGQRSGSTSEREIIPPKKKE